MPVGLKMHFWWLQSICVILLSFLPLELPQKFPGVCHQWLLLFQYVGCGGISALPSVCPLPLSCLPLHHVFPILARHQPDPCHTMAEVLFPPLVWDPHIAECVCVTVLFCFEEAENNFNQYFPFLLENLTLANLKSLSFL